MKDLWFHVHLIEGRVGAKRRRVERGLEALDGCLGEYHNVIVLQDILTTETPVPRAQIAASLRLLRLYERELRLRAALLGRRVLSEKPRHFVRRVRRLWQPQATRPTPVPRRRTWRQAA